MLATMCAPSRPVQRPSLWQFLQVTMLGSFPCVQVYAVGHTVRLSQLTMSLFPGDVETCWDFC
jgi:hypothetical protein